MTASFDVELERKLVFALLLHVFIVRIRQQRAVFQIVKDLEDNLTNYEARDMCVDDEETSRRVLAASAAFVEPIRNQ